MPCLPYKYFLIKNPSKSINKHCNVGLPDSQPTISSKFNKGNYDATSQARNSTMCLSQKRKGLPDRTFSLPGPGMRDGTPGNRFS